MSIEPEKHSFLPQPDSWRDTESITAERVLEQARHFDSVSPPFEMLQNVRDGVFIQIEQSKRIAVQHLVEEGAQLMLSLPNEVLREVGEYTARSRYKGVLEMEKFTQPSPAYVGFSSDLTHFTFINLWNQNFASTNILEQWESRQFIPDRLFAYFGTYKQYEEGHMVFVYGTPGVLLLGDPIIPQKYQGQEQDAYVQSVHDGIENLKKIHIILKKVAEDIQFPPATDINYEHSQSEIATLMAKHGERLINDHTMLNPNLPEDVYDPSFWENTGGLEILAKLFIAQNNAFKTSAFNIFMYDKENDFPAQYLSEMKLLLMARQYRWMREITLFISDSQNSIVPTRKRFAQEFLALLPLYFYALLLKNDCGLLDSMANRISYRGFNKDVYLLHPQLGEHEADALQHWRKEIAETFQVYAVGPAFENYLIGQIGLLNLFETEKWIKKDLTHRAKKEWITDEGTLDTVMLFKTDEVKEVIRREMMRLYREKAPDHLADPHLFELLEARNFSGLTESLATTLNPLSSHFFLELRELCLSVFLLPVQQESPSETDSKYTYYTQLINEYHSYLATTAVASATSEVTSQQKTLDSLIKSVPPSYLYPFLSDLLFDRLSEPGFGRTFHPWSDLLEKVEQIFPLDRSNDDNFTRKFKLALYNTYLYNQFNDRYRSVLQSERSGYATLFHDFEPHSDILTVNEPTQQKLQELENRVGRGFLEIIGNHGQQAAVIQSKQRFDEVNKILPYFPSTLSPEMNTLAIPFTQEGTELSKELIDKLQVENTICFLVRLENNLWGGIAQISFGGNLQLIAVFRSDGNVAILFHSNEQNLPADNGLKILLSSSIVKTVTHTLLEQKDQIIARSVIPISEKKDQAEKVKDKPGVEEKRKKRRNVDKANQILQEGIEREQDW